MKPFLSVPVSGEGVRVPALEALPRGWEPFAGEGVGPQVVARSLLTLEAMTVW